VRIDQEEPFRRSKPGSGERTLDQLLLGHPVLAGDPMDPQSLGDRLIDRLPRVQRRRRVLEHDLDAPPVFAEDLRPLAERLSLETDLALLRSLESHDRAREGRLAASRFAGEGEDLPPAELEVHAVDGPRGRPLPPRESRPESHAPLERHVQVPDLEDRAGSGR
jgi:hypothetical protein